MVLGVNSSISGFMSAWDSFIWDFIIYSKLSENNKDAKQYKPKERRIPNPMI